MTEDELRAVAEDVALGIVPDSALREAAVERAIAQNLKKCQPPASPAEAAMRDAIRARMRIILTHPLADQFPDAASRLAIFDTRPIPEAVAALEAMAEKPATLN